MWIQKVPGGGIDGLVYASDGRTLYTADRGGAVTAWNAATHEGRRLFFLASLIRGIALATDRYLVGRTSPLISVWDLVAASAAGGYRPEVPHDALPVPGDDRVLHLSADRRALLAWTPKPGTADAEFAGPLSAPVRAYALSPDAQTLALAGDYSMEVSLFDVSRQTEITRFEVATYDFVWGLRFSPNGRTLAVLYGHQVQTWDLSRRKPLMIPPVAVDNRHGEATFAFHPTAPMFVALNPQKALTLFSSETGEPVRSLDFALGKQVRCVTFSSDGLTCAVGGSNKQFAVFDVDL